MKRFSILLFLILFANTCVFSQYKVNKNKYSTKEYTYTISDPYHPFLCGLASYFIPGLGQIIAGENQRGLTFLGAYLGGSVITVSGMIMYPLNQQVSAKNDLMAVNLIISGLTISLGSYIWSIIDAVRVAKINNMAYRDKKTSSDNIKLYPFLGSVSSDLDQSAMGLTLQISLK